MFRFQVFVSLFLIFSLDSSTQTVLKGVLKDEKDNKIPFANIYIKDSYDGTTSDALGNYIFTTTETGEQFLIVSCIGYNSVGKKLILETDSLTVNIILFSKSIDIKEVVVSPSVFEASDTKRATVFKSMEIWNTPGAGGDLPKIVLTLPGTQLVGEKEGIFVRGGSDFETKTIIDGMVVQNPYFSGLPEIPQRGRLQPDLFKGVLFSTGGYSAEYGQALSAILDLKTNDLSDTSFTTVGLTFASISGTVARKYKKSSVNIIGDYTNLKPFFAVNKQNVDWINEPNGGNANLLFRQKLSKTGLLKVNGIYTKQKMKINIPDYTFPVNSIGYSLNNDFVLINTSYQSQVSKKSNLFTGISYTNNIDKVVFGSTNFSIRENMLQAKMKITRFFNKNTIITGINVHNRKKTDSNGISNKLDELYSAFFLESNVYLFNKIALRAGLRYENSNMVSTNNLDLRLSMVYKFENNSQISFSYGTFHQVSEDSIILENKLAFEKASHYILNYQWGYNNRIFRIELYDKEYDNLPLLISTNKIAYSNNGYGYARGIDVFWRDKSTIDGFDYWISYSFIDTKRKYNNSFLYTKPSFVSDHNLTLVAKYWFNASDIAMGFSYRYASSRSYYYINQTGLQQTSTTPDYYNVGINLVKMFKLFNCSWFTFFSVDNVFNRKNVFGYKYSSNGSNTHEITPPGLRTFFLGIFVKF